MAGFLVSPEARFGGCLPFVANLSVVAKAKTESKKGHSRKKM
jgi:hypothetical protein